MVFPSTLIISSDTVSTDACVEKILAELGHQKISNNPDILVVEDCSIAAIKSLKDFLNLKAYQHDCKIIIIPNTAMLFTEAQNALLKMLEEPGEKNYFILVTSNPGQLLPTIISRCRQLQLTVKTTGGESPYSFPSDLKTALTESENFATDKANVLIWLQTQLNNYHQQLIDRPSTSTATVISKLTKAISMINSNVDPKSALDYLFLS